MYGRGLNSCLDGISSCGLWIVDGEKVVWCVGDDVKEREGQFLSRRRVKGGTE
jgi:hypothetical protein